MDATLKYVCSVVEAAFRFQELQFWIAYFKSQAWNMDLFPLLSSQKLNPQATKHIDLF